MINQKVKKGLVLTLIIIFLISLMIPATGSIKNETPNDFDGSVIELNIDRPSLSTSTETLGFEAYAILEIENEGFTITKGQAKLPTIRHMIEIPYGADPQIIVKSDSWEYSSLQELNLPDRIIPVQPPKPKNEVPDDNSNIVIDNDYYSNDKFMQTETARIVEIGQIRDHRFALIEISPVQYNPFSGELKIMNKCEISIDLPGSDMEITSEKINRYSSTSFSNMFDNLFENYNSFKDGVGVSDKDLEGYMIIVFDNYYEEILPFAQWKQSIGFNVTVTNTSDIPGGTSTSDIHNYIEEAYYNWSTPPTYVLLVGDTDVIPTYTGQSSYTAADLYYVTMNTDDYFPDIFIGRFPAGNETDVTSMVDKTVYYEQGNFGSSEWIKKAVFMAGNDNYHITEGTHNHCISNYLDPNNYTSDKLYEVTYGATTQDVRESFNDGRSLGVYSGHGSTTSWADGPAFSQSDVRSLTNQDIYPFVCSHACVTGKFNNGECFGETWLRAPNKAALVFWGSSANTFWDEDDVLQKKMFYAWWINGLETIGAMTDMALYYTWEHYGGGGSSKYYFECYNILGDPSIKVLTEDPVTPPEISEINVNPYLQDPDNYVNISCKVVEDVLLTSVLINITYPDESIVSYPMNQFNDSDYYYYNSTYTSIGKYNYQIIAEDDDGNIVISDLNNFFIADTDLSTILNIGWNLITVPIPNTMMASDLASNISDCLSISGWDAVNQTYQTFIVGGPPSFDFALTDGQGYFADISDVALFYFDGEILSNVNISLKVGWNLIGWYHDYVTTASSIAENITGCLSISGWDSEIQTYKTYIVGGPPSFDFTVSINMGLFADVDVESTWQGEG
jgi:hypothetical protein